MAFGRRGSSSPTRPQRTPQRQQVSSPVRTQRGGTNFVRDVVTELRKVTWPTREETLRLTVIVIVVSVILGAALGGIDYVFYWLINSLLLGKQT